MSETVMSNDRERCAPAEELSQPVTIGVEAYISENYARAERDKLWAKVWQQVGRVEEIPDVGDYLTYEILDDSIIVVRTGAGQAPRLPQRLRASRPPARRHPGRRARTRCGRSRKQFVCGFHGWRYNLDGRTPTSPNATTGRAR